MNKQEINAIRLEERARLLMKVSEEVGDIIKQCKDDSASSASNSDQKNKKSKNPQSNRGRGGKGQSRGSQSMVNLSKNDTDNGSKRSASSRGNTGNYRGRGNRSTTFTPQSQNNENSQNAFQRQQDYPPSYEESVHQPPVPLLGMCPPMVFTPSYPPNRYMQQPMQNPNLMNQQMRNPNPMHQQMRNPNPMHQQMRNPNPMHQQMRNPNPMHQQMRNPNPMHQQMRNPNSMNHQIKNPPPLMGNNKFQPQPRFPPRRASPKNEKSPPPKKIHPKDIILQLQVITGFWTNANNLTKMVHRDNKEIMGVINSNGGIFSTKKDSSSDDITVELFPKIKMCSNFLSKEGCLKENCVQLHTCKNFLVGQCPEKENCPFGHTIRTNHNIRIFSQYCVEDMPPHLLFKLLQKILVKGQMFPMICSDYQTNDCTVGTNCWNLHICWRFVNTMGLCTGDDDQEKCSLNHSIKECEKVFIFFGISTNESPRDLLKLLKSKSNLSVSKAKSDQTSKGKSANAAPTRKKATSKKGAATTWQLEGEVEHPFICLKRLDGDCDDSNSDCKYLHSKSRSHWQFKLDKWYNFHSYHSKILESNYRNVVCDTAVLPKLDPKFCSGSMKSLPSLLGIEKFTVDFDNMTASSENKKKTIEVRVVSTPSSVSVDNDHSTINIWHFKNDQDQWQPFKLSKNCKITSEDLEKAFYENPKSIFKFTSRNFEYEIDFIKMTQTNVSTGTVRSLRVRPQVFQKTDLNNVKLPDHWSKLPSHMTFKIEDLDSSSDEYKSIREIVCQTSPMCCILGIQRIENGNLWRQFKLKEEEVKSKYKDGFLNVQKLFYGIEDQSDLLNISKENLDFRKHGTLHSSYGNGTYFYNSFATASKNSSNDDLGKKLVLVAHVIIGHITRGDSSMTRPPENPATSSLYDTTVNDVDCPNIFVKYDKQEYYPAYVVTFK